MDIRARQGAAFATMEHFRDIYNDFLGLARADFGIFEGEAAQACRKIIVCGHRRLFEKEKGFFSKRQQLI